MKAYLIFVTLGFSTTVWADNAVEACRQVAQQGYSITSCHPL